jgi:hypothetical protein
MPTTHHKPTTDEAVKSMRRVREIMSRSSYIFVPRADGGLIATESDRWRPSGAKAIGKPVFAIAADGTLADDYEVAAWGLAGKLPWELRQFPLDPAEHEGRWWNDEPLWEEAAEAEGPIEYLMQETYLGEEEVTDRLLELGLTVHVDSLTVEDDEFELSGIADMLIAL